jgi:hypothetical protein
VSLQDGFTKALSWISQHLDPDVYSNLLLAECLFTFIREPGDSEGELWGKYVGSIESVCRGGGDTDLPRAVKKCLRWSHFRPNSIIKLTQEKTNPKIDIQYRNLFLPSLYLRYTIGNFRFLDPDKLEANVHANKGLYIERIALMKTELEFIEKILGYRFSDYFAALLAKGEKISRNPDSADFKMAASFFHSTFGRLPETKVDYSVGFYSQLSVTYGSLVETLLKTID